MIEDLYFIILEIILAGVLMLVAYWAKIKTHTYWRCVYLAPAAVSVLALSVWGYECSLLGVYIGSVVAIIGFVWECCNLRRLTAGILMIGILVSGVICLVNPHYRVPDYAEEFEYAFGEMKSYYVLTEHKGIDWDTLYDKYLPRFKEAAQDADKVKNVIAWTDFVQEFSDMHVSYAVKDEELETLAGSSMYGNDYGLSIMRLDDGRYVAINVDAGSMAAMSGIRNGSEITAWDGFSMEEAGKAAAKSFPKIMNFAVASNEDFYEPLMIAGLGEESVEIRFLTEEGVEKSVIAPKQGAYYGRLRDSVEKIDKGIELSNLEWKEADADTVVLCMRQMFYDSDANYNAMEREIREQMLAYKESGKENLILDLRANGGGSGMYVKTVAKLIAPEGEHVYAYDGKLDLSERRYVKGKKEGIFELGPCETFNGENLWEHGEILILVNAQSVSAADHFVSVVKDFENVTIMGMTHSSCSAQGVSGVSLTEGSLQFSGVLQLEEDGTVFVDSGIEKEATLPLDVKVLFDERAVKVLFDENRDYVLQYALEYLWK